MIQWTAPTSGTATFTTCGGTTNFDTVLYARKNTITGPELFCNDDAVPACGADASKKTATVVACTTYFVFVDGWGSTTGNYTLTITPPSGTPANCGGDAGTDAADAPADVASEPEAEAGQDASAEEAAPEPTIEAGSEPASEASEGGGENADGGDSSADDGGGSGDDGAGDAIAEAGETGNIDASVPDATDETADAGIDAGIEAGPEGGPLGPPYPLRRAPNARYLVDQTGAPFLIQGDAAWSLIANLTLEEAETYLTDRQARGFNTIIVELIEHHFSQNPPANRYGEQPFTTPGDFSTPNEAYFARADAFINLAASHGIQMLLFPMYLGNNGGDEGWFAELSANGSTKASGWGAYVGTRYASFPNIIWIMSGDFTPPASGLALVDAVANGIKAHDPNHLMGSHGSSFNAYPVRPWTDIDAIYTYQPVGPEVLGAYNSQTQPVFLIETEYENEGATRQGLRQHAYESVLNGGTGQVIGNNPIWFFGTGWQSALNSTGAQDMSKFWALFSVRHWERLLPDAAHAFVSAGFSGASVEFASDASWGAGYFPSSRAVTVKFSSFAGAVTGKWFNVTTGVFTTISGSPFGNVGTWSGTTPSGDSVMIFEAP